MTRVFPDLSTKAQRGSKPRCHLLTEGAPEVVAARLTALGAPFASVGPTDEWMPLGFEDTTEAELDKAERLLDAKHRRQLAEWWLPADRCGATTPNFDIASTCTIGRSRGLLLVEAKAHDQELKKEASGRQSPDDASVERKASHPTIGAAIEAARVGLAAATGLEWQISRDSHYQMSNRFAWCWRLTYLGIRVVLVYLGFLSASEMADKGRPFVDAKDWSDLVQNHGQGVVPAEVWGRSWTVNGVAFAPLIASVMQPLKWATS